MSGACEQRDIDLHDLHESSVEPGGEPHAAWGQPSTWHVLRKGRLTAGQWDGRVGDWTWNGWSG